MDKLPYRETYADGNVSLEDLQQLVVRFHPLHNEVVGPYILTNSSLLAVFPLLCSPHLQPGKENALN
ncbi:hypothetical protein D3C81_923010 [compost metagenome]